MRNNIKRYRQEKGLLKRELGHMIYCTKDQISQFEQGTRDPSIAQMKALAQVLEYPVDKIFPEYDPRPTTMMSVTYAGKTNRLARIYVSTMEGLRKSARIRVGEKMMVKLGNVVTDGTTFVRGTVVQTTPYWFRVKLDKSGFSTCVHYQAFLSENDVRRA